MSKKSRHNEVQIFGILKESESGIAIEELCRKHGISTATFYKWKAKYGGMELSELKKLKSLEAEHSRLKQLYAELSLENAALKDILEKK
jgi:putative transposase